MYGVNALQDNSILIALIKYTIICHQDSTSNFWAPVLNDFVGRYKTLSTSNKLQFFTSDTSFPYTIST